jgi:hypothetical protein
MKRILLAVALVAGLSFVPASPAGAAYPPSPYTCYHGNVGPSNGNFWDYVPSGLSGQGRHYHRYDHYKLTSGGKYYFYHTDYVTCYG